MVTTIPLNVLGEVTNRGHMATLSQTLNPLKRSAEGGLEKNTTLQGAANNLGLAAIPTTPGGAAMIGARPKAADMAGTPAQLNAAQDKPAAPAASLETAVRQKQSRTETTATEQGKMQKSADMQALGGLGDRVTNFIDTQRQRLTTAAPAVAQANTPVASGTTVIADPAAATAALDALMADPSNMDKQKAVNLALGRKLDTVIQPAEIAGMYQTAQEATGGSGARAVDDNLNISTLISDPEFGYDAAELSNLLGLPADQISAMTVKQLTDAVNNTITSEFGASAANQQLATSGIAGQAERAMAQSAGRELSSTGIRSTEADQARLDEQIATADQVSFGGQTYQIENLLNDDTISGIITDYMNAPPGSPARRELERSEPSLIEFINRNEAILHDATVQLTHGADVFKQIQEQVKDLGTQGGAPIDKKLMTKLITGFGEDFQTAKVDPASIPFLANLTGKTDYEKSVVVNATNTGIEKGYATPEEIAGLNAIQLKGLDIGQPNSNWSKFVKNSQDIREFPARSEQGKVDTMVDGGWSIPEIKQAVQTGSMRSVLGIGSKVDLGSFNPNDLDASYKIFNPATTVAKASEGTSIPPKLSIPPTPQLTGHAATLEKKLGGAAVDGNISDADISAAGLDLEEMIALEDNVGKPGSNISGGITGIRRAATIAPTAADVDKLLATGDTTTFGAWSKTADALANMARTMDPRRRDIGTLRARATSYITQFKNELSKIAKTTYPNTNNTWLNVKGQLLNALASLRSAGLLEGAGNEMATSIEKSGDGQTVPSKSPTKSGGTGSSAGGYSDGRTGGGSSRSSSKSDTM